MVGASATKVAIVTGGSRGLGRGAALGLGELGAIVYITGRSLPGGSHGPGTVTETADEVSKLGGRGIAVRCDHRDDAEVAALFQRVQEEQGRLDILVNNVYLAPELSAELPRSHSGRTPIKTPFWKLPISYWDELFTVSARSHYVASVFAAPLMVAQASGLIVNVSSHGGTRYSMNVPYGAEKATVHKLAADMAYELRPYSVAVVALAAPPTTTELSVGYGADAAPDAPRTYGALFTGRAIAALVRDPAIMERSGRVLDVLQLAQEHGFSEPARPHPAS